MPAVFEQLGIRFEYPESWQLDEEEARAGGDTITVYSPGGAFWSLNIQPPLSPPDELAGAAVEAMRSEYEDLEVVPARDSVEGVELTGYDMNFYCLDLTNSASVRACEHGDATYVILWQAEDREFDQISPVFAAITASLMR
ncbi:MAG: hypothetical protein DWQ31_12925 [Planctomycetota bacterium]|nr:MAG: hypothetical protein DWQ31_12925 [Planctomycetota bacterium]REJ89407.1 MAG: hypothetical protein DWQ35_18165 [Planctomycetota bacterium]REK26205.1 MAG: hypothetical protein DWQ42_09760 [Planctomycetota bacterium]REK44537.1 MAG: hypothetical protein DWQ46_09785 [Planctomycetota bacterium]